MTAKRERSSASFVSLERRAWAETHLLATNASVDFQKFTDETFHNLRRRYFSPADVTAETKRSGNKASTQWRVRRKSSAN
jgi:hypothetical protein